MSKEKLIPALRFPEFKDDGEWCNKILGEVATFSKGKGISKSDIAENGSLQCIRYGELYTYYNETITGIKSSTNLNPNELVLSESNDVITPASGFNQIDIATAYCVLKEGVALGGDLNIIKTEINGVFLAYYLNNAKKRDIARLAQGISVVHLYYSQLKTLDVSIPKRSEQQKIASCLSSLDELITAQSQKIEALQQHKKGLMQNLFPQEGQKVPNYRFPEFEDDGEWCNKPIYGTGETVNGLSGKKGADFGNGSPYVQYKQVFDKSFIDFSECSKVDVGSDEKQNQLQLGDILFTTSSETPDEVGFASVIIEQPKEPTYLNSFCFILRPNNLQEIKPRFSRYLFHSPIYRKSVSAIAQGSTRYNLSKGAFLKLRIPVPEPQEQQKIASCLSSLDELITAQTEKIEQLQEHKKGLMQGLFPKNNN